MAHKVPFVVAELGTDADLFMLHLYLPATSHFVLVRSALGGL